MSENVKATVITNYKKAIAKKKKGNATNLAGKKITDDELERMKEELKNDEKLKKKGFKIP